MSVSKVSPGSLLMFSSRWVMLYNANLDRSEPNRKSQTALRQELKKWEETMSKRKKTVIDDPKEHAVS